MFKYTTEAIIMALATSMMLTFGVMSVLADDVTVTASVSPYIDVTANYNAVGFGSLTSPSSNNVPTLNQTEGLFNFTVDTNKDYKIEANATDFSGDGVIANENLKMDSDTVSANLLVTNSKVMDTTPTTIDTNIAYASADSYHGFWLTVPASQVAGDYTTTLTVTISNVA